MVIKVKVQLSLYLIQHHVIKTHEGVGVLFHALLTSELDGGEWSIHASDRFTFGIHWTASWVSPRSGLDALAERKMYALGWNRTPIVQPEANNCSH
jgi:hypothetical protein